MTNFIAENNTPVALVLFDCTFTAKPVSALLFITFLCGGIIGLLSGALMVFKLRLQSMKLAHKLKHRDEELKKLRVNTFKGLS